MIRERMDIILAKETGKKQAYQFYDHQPNVSGLPMVEQAQQSM
jgi:hypothetical protein